MKSKIKRKNIEKIKIVKYKSENFQNNNVDLKIIQLEGIGSIKKLAIQWQFECVEYLLFFVNECSTLALKF